MFLKSSLSVFLLHVGMEGGFYVTPSRGPFSHKLSMAVGYMVKENGSGITVLSFLFTIP